MNFLLLLPLLLAQSPGAGDRPERFPFSTETSATYERAFEAVMSANPDTGRTDVERLLADAPENPRTWRLAGLLHLRTDQLREAETAFERALDLGIDGNRRADVLSSLAGIHLKVGANAAARKRVAEALGINPLDQGALIHSTLLDIEANQYQRARVSAERLLEVAPEDGYGHALLAGILANLDDLARARTHMIRARELGVEMPYFEQIEEAASRDRLLTLAWQLPLGMLVLIGVGLLGVWIAGRFLSDAQLGQLRASDVHLLSSEQSAAERRVDRAYTGVLWFATLLFYAAVPMMLVITLATGGALLFGVLLLPVIPIKLLIIVGFIGLGGLFAILKGLFTTPPESTDYRELQASEAPRLFEALTEVAEVAQSRAVDRVFVDASTGIGVREAGGRLKVLLGRGERTLHLGLGALRNLTTSELKSILAHEYGHFSHGETRLTPVISRVQVQVLQTIQAIAQLGWSALINPVWWFLRAYLWVYLQITSGHGRRRELLADRVSALTYGGDTFGRALSRVIENGAAFDRGVSVAVALRQFGRPVTDLFRTIDAADRSTPEPFRALVRQELFARPVDKFDSHPPPSERIERVAQIPASRPVESEPAWSLFKDPEALSREVAGEILMNIDTALQMRGIDPAEVPSSPEQSVQIAEAIGAHYAALALDERGDSAGYQLLPATIDQLALATGESDRMLAGALAEAAQVHLKRNNSAEARASLQRALGIVEGIAGPDDRQTQELKEQLSKIPEARAA